MSRFNHGQFAFAGEVTHHGRWIVRKYAGHRRQIADVPIHYPEERNDSGLVRGNLIEVTHFIEPVGLCGRSCPQTVVALPGPA